MKRIVTVIAFAVSVLLLGSVKNNVSAQAGISVSFQTFYDELSPYGRWIEYPEYGYVWTPDLGPAFQPYSTGGQWVWTDEYDWTWVSDYDWGWAPFHYGRWFYDEYYGWMWVPGYDWSPAWVSWRTGGDYYGWAPLRPGISININFGFYNPPANYWCFTPRRYIHHRNISNYCVDRSSNVTIINNTTIINNYGNRNTVFINGGPGRHDAERFAGRIRSASFKASHKPGNDAYRNNTVSVYRPRINPDSKHRSAPGNYDRYIKGNGNRNIANNRHETFSDRRSSISNREFNMKQHEPGQPGIDFYRSLDRERNKGRTDRRINRIETDRQESNDSENRVYNRRSIFDNNTNTNQPSNSQREETMSNQGIDRTGRNSGFVPGTDHKRNTEFTQSENRNSRRELFERNKNMYEQNNIRQTPNQNQYQGNEQRRTERRELIRSNNNASGQSSQMNMESRNRMNIINRTKERDQGESRRLESQRNEHNNASHQNYGNRVNGKIVERKKEIRN